MKIIKFQKPVYFTNIIEEQMTENGMDTEWLGHYWRDHFNPVWDAVGLNDHLVATQIYAELT